MDKRALRPDQPRMTDAEFRIARHALGVNQDWLARRLSVSERTVRNWEDGKHPIPPGVAGEITGLITEAEKLASGLVGQLAGIDLPTIYTYRDDDDYRNAEPDGAYCAGWHRTVAARVAAANPNVVIAYYSRLPHLEEDLAEQLLDVLNGVYIDAVARCAPQDFLVAEIEDCLDEVTGRPAYPELLAAAHSWDSSEAAAVLVDYEARRRPA